MEISSEGKNLSQDTCSAITVPLSIESASPAEITLVERTIRERHCKDVPERIIGDKAYDSDPHDEHLRRRFGVELIAPHKRNRKKPPTQDGRALRRYKNRWRIERLFSWLQNFRRIETRYEYKAENYLGMVQLGGIMIILRRF
jgi:transposase